MKREQQSLDRVAVAYERVSSKEQEKEGYSIPAQQKLLHAYARENNISILQDFVDVETAKKAGRTAFGEMVHFLKKNAYLQIAVGRKNRPLVPQSQGLRHT